MVGSQCRIGGGGLDQRWRKDGGGWRWPLAGSGCGGACLVLDLRKLRERAQDRDSERICCYNLLKASALLPFWF